MTRTAAYSRWFSSTGLRRLADRVIASDPGLKRLREASRVTLSVAATAVVAYLLIVVAAGGFSLAPLFGGVVSLFAPIAVRDASLKSRKVTTLLLFFPASLSVAAASLLSPVVWAQGLALSAVVFFAFYLRRYGARYVAIGLIAAVPFVVTSIVSSLLGFGAAQLPWIVGAIAVGVICVYLIRFYLLPDSPRSVLRRSLSAFDLQLALTLETITGTLDDRRSDTVRNRRLRREIDRLHERTSATEGQLLAEEMPISRERSDQLRLHLFDTEMSASTLSEIIWRDATSECTFPTRVRDPMLRALEELCATLRSGAASGQPPQALRELEDARAQAATGEADAGWSFQVRRADAAIRQLSEGAGEEEETGPAVTGEEREDEDVDNEREARKSPREDRIAGGLHPTTVQGIQATLAVGLALVAGEIFSPSRPYWVVIVAFVVFMGSGTLGDTLTRGVQRTAGTLVGAVVGFLLASVIPESLYVEVPLIVACVFLAFYMFSISQTVMMFWITIVLALAFDLLGLLGGGGILVLRFFDTLLGSAIGFAVSALVLPTRPSDEFRDLISSFLVALEEYVCDRVRWLAGGEETSRHAVEQAREVDSELQALLQSATLARAQVRVFGRTRTNFNHWMTGLLALNYYAHHLAGPVDRRQRLEAGSEQGELLREIGDRLAANINSLQQAVYRNEEPEIQDIEELMQRLVNDLGAVENRSQQTASYTPDVSPPPPADRSRGQDSGQAGPANALHYLRRINRTLDELAAEPVIRSKQKDSAA